jgi:hypothetical protein
MIAEFSARTFRLVSDHEVAFPGTAGFLEAIAEARKIISAIPPEFLFTFRLKVNPATMGSDPVVVIPRLLGETEAWLGFIVHSVAYRIGQFLDDVITGIDAARPYRSVGAARCLLELSAFVYHHTKKLRAAVEATSQTADDFAASVKAIVETFAAARDFVQVTLFNWNALVRGDMDEFFTAWDKVDERVKAKRILNYIDKLPGDEKRSARFFYEMLCDYVHPNVAAHTLVVNRALPVQDGQMRWELSREPDSSEALSVLLLAVAIPVRHSVRILLHDLGQLQQMQGYFEVWRKRCESLVQCDLKS